jgi:two-component system response regulator CpxR
MELGAFAFLSKSVDIDELSKTIKAANEKIRRTRAGRKSKPTDR